MVNPMSTIPVIVEKENQTDSDTLGILSPDSYIKDIDTDVLKESFSSLSEKISSILSSAKQVGDFKLKEIKLAVEINAEGGVSLVGNAKAGAKGAITLTYSI